MTTVTISACGLVLVMLKGAPIVAFSQDFLLLLKLYFQG